MPGRTAIQRRVALIVTPRYLPILGGQERECALLAEAFGRLGFEPVVVTEQLGFETPRSEIDEHGARVHRIPSSFTRTLRVQLIVALRMALLVLRYRRRAEFAIVRTATLPALLVGLMKLLRLIRFPTLMTAETGGEWDDIVALGERPLFAISRRLASAHDRLNGICQANVDHLRQYGFPEDKISFVPNGVDTSAYSKTRPPSSIRRFLFVGRLDREKGLYELLDAFAAVHAHHPDIRLTIAGEGPERDDLVQRIAAHGLEGPVELIGRVEYEKLAELFDRHDCLVLPSYSEGMPLSVLEAATHHRALLVTDVGDMRLMFGEHARIIPPGDAAALEQALEAAVADPQPRADYDELIAKVGIDDVARALLDELGVAGVASLRDQ